MPTFKGFPSGKVRFTPIPGPFFSELLPEIDHLGELKVTLYALWYLDQQEGNLRFIRREDFLADQRLTHSLSGPEALDEALERAVLRGTLLKVDSQGDQGTSTVYLLNTARGRAAVKAIQNGDLQPSAGIRPPVTLDLDRPNIFKLYEENIGPLTPLVADSLREAEQTYPATWVEEAFRIAVENNVRRWRYIEAILRSWQEEGRDEQNRGDAEKDRRKYVEGKYSVYFEH